MAEDIYQVRLPLPFALNHVNCYLLRDADGWTVVDTGLHWPDAQAAWTRALAELQIGFKQIRRIVLTHMHPDHFGLAGYFQAQTDALVYLSPREAEQVQTIWVEDGWHSTAAAEFWQVAGVPAETLAVMGVQTEQLRQRTMPHPQHYASISPGTLLTMGGRSWQVIHAPGHSDGQIIFYAAAEKLMLCGDQVLMKITPNIGLWPGIEADPLGRYLQSLAALAELDVACALPGHGGVITTWQTRLSELQQHHVHRLEAMVAAVQGGATAFQVAQRVFHFANFSEHEIRFALAETLAHLVYLVQMGRLYCQTVAGVGLFQPPV